MTGVKCDFVFVYMQTFLLETIPCILISLCTVGFKGCGRKILNVGGDFRMARGYTAVGPMAPFYVFPCGHAFHAQCLIAHVTRCTTPTQVSNGVDPSSVIFFYPMFLTLQF